jgi:AraC-like DNA-binding protein
MYSLSRPAGALAPYIEHYWHVDAAPDRPFDLTVDVFVDLRADLIFNFGVPYQRTVSGGETRALARSNLDAQRLRPIRIVQHGVVRVAGVRFRVGGLMPFVARPVQEFTNRIVGLDEAFGHDGVRLEHAVGQLMGDDAAQGRAMDAFFLDRMDHRPEHDLVHSLVAQIDASAGRLSVTELSRLSGRSTRTIDRLFRRHLGTGPKTYAQIARFQRCLARLTKDPGMTLSQVAVEGGYFDHSHFVRDYRRFAGTAPARHAGYFPDHAPQDFRPNLVRFVQDGAG